MKMSILIADNHEVVRRDLRALVEAQQDWEVCGEAATVVEAIEQSGRLCPDLLLLGLTLPDMDAAAAIPEIIEVCPSVKIVALATQDSGEMTANALAAGAIGIAMKSDPANHLLLTLESIGMNEPFLSPAGVRLLQDQLARQGTSVPQPHDLTPRELEILKLRAKGWTVKAIAGSLDISVKTVDAHRAAIMRKLRLDTYSDLIRFAIRHDLIER